jgi:hypothetical protein
MLFFHRGALHLFVFDAAWSLDSPIAADLLEDEVLRASVEFLLGRVLLTKSEAVHDLTYAARQADVNCATALIAGPLSTATCQRSRRMKSRSSPPHKAIVKFGDH